MRRPLILLAAILAAIVAASWWLHRARNPAAPAPAPVAIQDRATIDFSSGKPVVKDTAAERELIDHAMKEIAEAAKQIKFEPLVPPKVELPPPPAKSTHE